MAVAALLGPHLLALAIMAIGLRESVRQRRLYAFLFLGVVAYQVLTIPSIPAMLEEFGADVLLKGELVVLAGASTLVIAITVLERALGRRQMRLDANPIADAGAQWRVYYLALSSCLVLVLILVTRQGTVFIEGNWQELRSEATRLDALATLLQFLVIPGAWVAFRSGRRIVAVLLLAFALALFAILGSRAALLTLPAIAAIDLYRSKLNTRNLRIAVVGVVIAVMMLHVGGRVVRGFGLGGVYELLTGNLYDFGQLAEGFAGVDWSGGEAEIARYYSVVIRDAPIGDVESLASPIRWLTMYLPRDAAPALKPEDVTYALWRHAANEGVFDAYASWTDMLDLLRSGQGGSVHPTLWGEMWLNGEIASIPVCCLFLALWLVLVDRLVGRMSAALSAFVAPAIVVGYFMVARGNSVVGLGYAAYLLPVASLLIFISSAVDRSLRSGTRRRCTEQVSEAGQSGRRSPLDEFRGRSGAGE